MKLTNNSKTIRIIDSIMGSGKTTYVIEEMNRNKAKRYIYVTPFLDETNRIKSQCPELNFKLPSDTFSKTASFEDLVKSGHNIAMSHALFARAKFSKATFNCIKEFGYDLILDEELECIEADDLTKSDSQLLISKNTISIENGGRVVWRDPSYTGKFKETRRSVESGSLYSLGSDKYIWLLSTDLLDCFENITIVTYLYKYSLLYEYLKLKGFNPNFFYVQDGTLKPGQPDNSRILADIRSKISIYEGPLNRIGDHPSALSASWYRENSRNGGKLKVLLNNAYNYLHNIVHGNADNSMWSVFKGADGRVKTETEKDRRKQVVQYFVSSELPCNARATNLYKDRTNLAYLCNLYLHPFQTEYFAKHDVCIDTDRIALSRLLQWIWRSAIREGKPVNLYLPASRMRRLFISWLFQDKSLTGSTS